MENHTQPEAKELVMQKHSEGSRMDIQDKFN